MEEFGDVVRGKLRRKDSAAAKAEIPALRENIDIDPKEVEDISRAFAAIVKDVQKE